jgi:hypothetical protein
MARRRIAAWKYFNGDSELENIRWYETDDDGKPVGYPRAILSAKNMQFGTVIGAPRLCDYSAGHIFDNRSDWLPVERRVRFLTKADPHQCDWRCVGAKPGGDCWCSCGGRNHGRNYHCEAA